MWTTLSAAFPLFSLAFGAINFSVLESCVTQSGTLSVKSVSTSVSTTTIHKPNVHVKHTVHPQHFITPRPFTRTWTHTFHETDTAVATVTITLTEEDLVPTSTSVATVTHTHVSNVRSTVSVPSGFLPINNTTNSAYPGIGSHSNATASFFKTAAHNASATVGASASASMDIEARNARKPGAGLIKKEFAHAVHCLKSILVQSTIDSTITGTTQTTTLAQPTTTITMSTTSTTVVQPKRGHGKTVYTTVYTTVTRGFTVHTTQIVNAEVTSTTKAYAACQTNNLMTSVASVSSPGSEKLNYNTTLANSAQECCGKCMESDECTGSAYMSLLPYGGRCFLYYSNTCSSQSANSLEYFTSASKYGGIGELVVSNGLCGYMYSGGKAANDHAHGFGFPQEHGSQSGHKAHGS